MITLKSILESLIFVSDKPLTLDKLAEALPEFERSEIKSSLSSIVEEYSDKGIQLVEVGGGWQFRSSPNLSEYIVRMQKVKTVKFSQSFLETLAIIAYRQPITRHEIEELRGVDSGNLLKKLLEKRLIRIIGKKDVPGRPIIYGTSKEFLEVFSLKDLKGLPTIKEISALDNFPEYDAQKDLPLDGITKPVQIDFLVDK